MTVEKNETASTEEAVAKALESIEGLWTVIRTSGESYDDHSYDSNVGLFASEALADAYVKAHEDIYQQVRRDEYNTGSWQMWRKKFVPIAPTTMPKLDLYYIVETSRSFDKNGKREIEKVEVVTRDMNQEPWDEAERLARENPGKAFQQTSKYGEPEVFAESSEFPALVLDEDGQDYDGQYETFYSFTKNAVVLDPPEGYIHPEPIPWEPVRALPKPYNPDEEEKLADWEKELLGINDDKEEDTEETV